MEYSRRTFLKILGIGSAGALLSGDPVFAEIDSNKDPSIRSYGLLNDGTRCVGCHSCENACREFNQLPSSETGADGEIVYPEHLDNNNFTRIETRSIQPDPAKPDEIKVFRRHMCFHCEQPSCASACPVGALVKSPEGPVYYRAERCIGCRYCMNACPFSIPKYEWNSNKPFVRKCTMCYEKVSNHEPTSCSSVCPVGAIKFGYRDDLIEEARQRIASDPSRYQNYIYGEQEVGGTSVIYLTSSMVPFEDFGFPMGVGTESYPSLTWAALSRVPGIALYVVVWVSLVYFITQRRIPLELQAEKSEDTRGEVKS